MGWNTTVWRCRRSAWTRSTDCWAIVPLGRNAAAGLPSSSAISASSSATTPPSPYRSTVVSGGMLASSPAALTGP